MNRGFADGQDAPLLPPWPNTDFEALNRRQSIIAWTVGAGAGIVLASLAIAAFVLELI